MLLILLALLVVLVLLTALLIVLILLALLILLAVLILLALLVLLVLLAVLVLLPGLGRIALTALAVGLVRCLRGIHDEASLSVNTAACRGHLLQRRNRHALSTMVSKRKGHVNPTSALRHVGEQEVNLSFRKAATDGGGFLPTFIKPAVRH